MDYWETIVGQMKAKLNFLGSHSTHHVLEKKWHLPTTPRTPYQQLSLGVEASWFGAAFQQGVLADFIILKAG